MEPTTRSAGASGTQVVLAGALWALGLAYFAAQVVAQAAWTTPYSLLDNRVSDLGSTSCRRFAQAYVCSPLHAVMNTAFVVTGVLILAGLVLGRRVWPRRRLTTWGLALLTVAGLGTVLVGLAPEDRNVVLHLVGALNIPAGNLALILLGLAVREVRPRIAALSVTLGVVGLLGLLAGPPLIALTGHGGGVAERLALYPLIVWMIGLGLWLLCSRPDDRLSLSGTERQVRAGGTDPTG